MLLMDMGNPRTCGECPLIKDNYEIETRGRSNYFPCNCFLDVPYECRKTGKKVDPSTKDEENCPIKGEISGEMLRIFIDHLEKCGEFVRIKGND